MRVIIMCAGKSSRFKRPYPKHMAEIGGIPCVERIINKLREFGVSDIHLTVSGDNKKFFDHIDVNKIIGSGEREIDRFRNAFNSIKDDSRVLYLYGDVLYAHKDIGLILNYKSDDNIFFGRRGRNKVTKKSHGEIFAVLVNDVAKFVRSVNEVARLYDIGYIKREIGWEVYRVDNGIDAKFHKVCDNFVKLSMHTDDFDSVRQYNRLVGAFKKLSGDGHW